MDGKKICSKCGVEKGLGEFHKFKHSKDGVKTICKLCISTINKIPENRIKKNENHKLWVGNNKEKVKGYKLKEYEKNRPNKDERKEKYKLWSLLKYKCICGSEITNGNKSHHFDTDKHQTYELIQTL